MAGRKSKKKQVTAGIGALGVGAGLFLAAAAAATGSAAPARADFDDLIDPIITPLLTSFTDSVAVIDPAAALDVTSWADNLLSGMNAAFDTLAPSTDSALAAASVSAEPAATAATGSYDLPITVYEGTEPTVQASVDGASSVPVLVDTGSSGLVIPWQDLGSGSELQELLSLGTPSSFGESGYSGGVEYLYLTYNNVSVDYGDGLTTDGPVEVEVYSYAPGNFLSLFSNDAFQNFLDGNDSAGGILGIGDNVSGGAGASPFDSYGNALVELNNSAGGNLIVGGGTNPYPIVETISNNGSTATGLTETVNGVSVSGISDDLDTGGVQGTIPSTITGVAAGDTVTVTNPTTGATLYSYTIPTSDAVPVATSGTSIDSGYYALVDHPLYIDYANDKTYLDQFTPLG